MVTETSAERLEGTHAIKKTQQNEFQVEEVEKSVDLVYEDVDEEPELHMRTWIVLGSMFWLDLVQLIALQGPPAMLDYIGNSFGDTQTQTWIPNALALIQVVLRPIISAASDTFQVRKSLLVGSCVVSFVGSAIASGSNNIHRVVVAQVLIGFGFAAVLLSYCVPSEIVPGRWRPGE
ncbi:uncharacterized protein Z518_02119 [Rhinocladiella mackenziei CBS 650.93]|uniref:Major facilitator superfamily (MFS) profile domain-containing protein n=1 Tax=Rhinocladiella mackenziei CBS 650.93 TaxID=1442369 RepID=A0A0D2IW41_9EURO|nr:uncharacterized protein Z518_02119 [Rhinocladiella mackenziei CBS 650.93]KIX07466.1 hypothetical protein Z518_02119 [Rhinocladiella mackenziei CBS 650.93]